MRFNAKIIAVIALAGMFGGLSASLLAVDENPVDPAAFSSYVSKVVKVADSVLTVHSLRGLSGNLEDLHPEEKTVIVLAGKPAKLTDLKANQWVRIHWNYADEAKKTIKIIKIEDAEPLPGHKNDAND